MEKFPLITVKWKDHYSLSGWVEISSLEEGIDDYINTTTGYKVFENDEYLVVSHTLSHDVTTVGDAMFVIKDTIVKVEILHENPTS